MVPSFVSKNRRNLQDGFRLSQIDVTDIFDFKFGQKPSEEYAEPAKYSLEMKEWTEFNLNVQMDFNDPLAVS